MADIFAYRITDDGTETIRLTDDGYERVTEYAPEPSPPPDWLQQVIHVRRNVGDPITLDFLYIDSLPDSGMEKTAYTTGNGSYWYYAGTWKKYGLQFSDAYIRQLVEARDKWSASLILIDNLIAQINPADYITSGSAGGQSVSFPSLADMLAYYKARKEAIQNMQRVTVNTNGGGSYRCRPRAVGGEYNC
jgi:hypothetical protein